MEGNLWLYRLYFRVVILLWLPVSLSAVDLPNLTFRTITISDGLSNNIINTIYKDKRGFIWLGTQTGLDRFDGINMKSFLQFSGRTIFSIAETDSVYLWVGTDKGLWKLDRKTDQVESVTLDTKSLEVRSVFVSQTGRLLVGTTHGLFIYQESAFRKVLFGSNALSSINFITGIVEGYKDTFWLTSQGGLIEYNIETGQSKVYTYQDDEKFVSYFSCLALLKEKLYLGTAGSGMLVFDIGKAAFSICPEVENGYIKSIITVNDEIWVGTNGSGIRIISASTGKELSAIEHTSNADAICSNAVYSLLKEDDMLWVGTYMGGLSYTPAHGSFFSVYSYPELFNSYNMNVRAFWVDADGKKVIGTRDGLYYISETEQRIRHYTHRNSILRSDIILSVKPFNRDFLIGTYGGGLYLLHRNTGELSFFQSDQCFMQGSFNGYERDGNNKLWIGSSKGVYVYDHLTGEYEVYNSRNSSLSVNSVFSLKADSKGRMWLGTGGAVFMYDRAAGVFKSDVFPEHVLPYTKSVRFIYEDKKKNLWFCDDKEGVVKVDESFTTFEHITIDDFLPNNSVMSIVEDPKNGGLWFATQRGLLYIKEEENYHKIFSLYDGIPGYIFNSPVQITDDNTIWWGNECGLVCYDAAKSWSEIGTKEVQPPVITSISVAGRPLCPGETLMPVSAPFIDEVFLSVNDNNISFTFSALNYAVENTDLYEYCLEEYDKEWKTLMKGNQVSYTELPVGDYMFRVRAAAICGADMKHYKVDNGSDEFNSIRGHEFAGEIVEVGEKVTDWKVGQRVVSDNSAHVCGVCPACEQGDFLCCESKVNLGLDNNTWGGGFSKYCKVPGEILRIHKHAIWEIPENVKYEEAAVLDPICNSYQAIAQQSHLLPGQDVVVFGTGPLGLFAVQVARIMGAVNIVMVGLDEDVPVRFPVAKELGATHCVNGSKEDVVKRCTEICGRDNLGLLS